MKKKMIYSAFIIFITLCSNNIDCIAKNNIDNDQYYTSESITITNVGISKNPLSKQIIVNGNVCRVIRLYLANDTEEENISDISKNKQTFIVDESVEYNFYSGDKKLSAEEGEKYFINLIKKVPKAVIILRLDTNTKKVIGISRAEYLEKSVH